MKSTLVIGGTTGIGAEVVEQLRHNERFLWSPAKEGLDVCNPAQIGAFFYRTGPFDEIVYSAGINQLAWIPDLGGYPDPMMDTYEVNVFGFVRVMAIHRRLYPDHGFSAVAVASDAARIPMRGSLAYGSSKAALVAVIQNAARELAPSCRINGVSPAMVEDTPMTDYIDATVPEFRGWTKEYARAYEETNIPMGRRVTKGEVAQVIVSTLEGPEFMTGSIIDIAGGR